MWAGTRIPPKTSLSSSDPNWWRTGHCEPWLTPAPVKILGSNPPQTLTRAAYYLFPQKHHRCRCTLPRCLPQLEPIATQCLLHIVSPQWQELSRELRPWCGRKRWCLSCFPLWDGWKSRRRSPQSSSQARSLVSIGAPPPPHNQRSRRRRRGGGGIAPRSTIAHGDGMGPLQSWEEDEEEHRASERCASRVLPSVVH